MNANAKNARQKRFVHEYLIDLNGCQAAIRAGYSQKTAQEQASRLLSNVKVQKEIERHQKERQGRTEVTQDYVLKKLVDIAEMDVLDILNDNMSLKPVSQWPKIWRQFLSGFDVVEMFEGRGDDREMIGLLKKIKWPDKVKNLELLGRHLGMFKDRVEHTGKDGGPIQHENLSDDPNEAVQVYLNIMQGNNG